jgi:hypothetical protein
LHSTRYFGDCIALDVNRVKHPVLPERRVNLRSAIVYTKDENGK